MVPGYLLWPKRGLLGLAKIAKVVLKFCVIPVSKWYLGIYFAESKLENGFWQILLFWELAARFNNLDNLAVKCFKS